VNKADFVDWKRHPVTQVVFSQLATRVNDLQEILGNSAGENPMQDRMYVGAINAYKDILNMDFEGGNDD
jgi:hypothetical protein